MKRIIEIFLIPTAIIMMLTGCGDRAADENNTSIESTVSEESSEETSEMTQEDTEPDEFGYKKRNVTMKSATGSLLADDDATILYTMLTYPEIGNPDNLKGIEELNTMYSMMSEQIASSHGNTEIAKSAEEAYKRLGDEFIPFSSECSITVTYNKGNIISLRVEREEFREEDEGMYVRLGDTRFLDTNENVKLTDIFDMTEEDINVLIIEGFNKMIDQNPDKYYPDAKEKLKAEVSKAGWYINEEGVAFALKPETIAQYSEGCIEYVCKFKGNEEIFKPSIF